MKILSWYIKGVKKREKELIDLLKDFDPNICCIQRTATLTNMIPENLKTLSDYETFINSRSENKQNGLITYTDLHPDDCINGIEDNNIPGMITLLEFKNFYLYNVYLPLLEKPDLEERVNFVNSFVDEVIQLKPNGKPIILAGLFNITPKDIDLYNPKEAKNIPGARKRDREILNKLLNNGFVDAYRYLNPQEKKYTTWYSLRNGKPWKKEEGWRTDLFLVANLPLQNLKSCTILDNTFGSDHAPILLELEI